MLFWHGSCPYHAKMKKIMKRIGILIGWLVWTAGVSAQSWSLDDCMKYAVEHATEVKREVVNARQRKQDYQHAVAGFLPTVTGGVQGQYAWGRNIDPETNTYNNVTTFNNYYQLYAELNVFDGFATINALKQAKLSRDYSATAMQKIQEPLYYQTLTSDSALQLSGFSALHPPENSSQISRRADSVLPHFPDA